MLLKIDVNPEDIVYAGGGRIIVKLHYYAPFAHGCHLSVFEDETKEDFDKLERKSKPKTIFVGVNGGLSMES